MAPVRMILFDCDGTLVDSQYLITDCMGQAFSSAGFTPPERAAVRQIIGLSLSDAIYRLLQTSNADGPAIDTEQIEAIRQAYVDIFHERRSSGEISEDLFDGTRAILEWLASTDIILGVVTGKTRRGLDAVLAHHGLAGYFSTLQTSDGHPSKPHPAMVQSALIEQDVHPAQTLVVGDTTFDMVMAKAAGCRAVGVSWGYHDPIALKNAGAEQIIDQFHKLGSVAGFTVRRGEIKSVSDNSV